MSLRVNSSDISKAYEFFTEFVDYEWEGELNGEDDIHLSVFLKPEDRFVASASIQKYKTDTIELGYDVVKEYRNIGIASEIVAGLLKEVHRIFKESIMDADGAFRRFFNKESKQNSQSKET